MFTHLLAKDDIPFGVEYTDYAKKHYLKRFIKSCPGTQWEYTEEAIFRDLSSISYSAQDLQQSQQVDELWHKDSFWIFKYDFKIAGKHESTKGSGNRCIVFLDNDKKLLEILMIYNKNDLPKSPDETHYIKSIIATEFPDKRDKCI